MAGATTTTVVSSTYYVGSLASAQPVGTHLSSHLVPRAHPSSTSLLDIMTVDMKPTANVPLGTGPPTREELLVHYPAKFTWNQLKVFVNAG